LRVGVLARYAALATPIFDRVRLEETIEFDDDVWREIVGRLRGAHDAQPARVRWLLQHVCGWLTSAGFSVPLALVQKDNVLPRVPRSPIYVTKQEIERSAALLQAGELDFHSDATAQSWMRFMRYVPSRTCEIQFATLNHFDGVTGLFAITTSGHGHLKNDSAHGLVDVPKALQSELKIIQERRCALGETRRVSFFGSADVTVGNVFEEQSKKVTRACSLVTGREHFRIYDLRVAAITDLIAAPLPLLLLLQADFDDARVPMTAKELSQQFSRCAFAARQARHTTTFSTLRSYYCGGVLELAVHLRKATSRFRLSTAHLSAILGQSETAIDAQCLRMKRKDLGKNGSPKQRKLISYKILQSSMRAFIDGLPTPALSAYPDETIEGTPATRSAAGARLFCAAMQMHFGFPLNTAADNCDVNPTLLKRIVERVERIRSDLKLKRTSHLVPAFLIGGAETLHAKYLTPVSDWFYENRDRTRLHPMSVLPAIAKIGTHMHVTSAPHLTDLIELFKGIESIGIQVCFQFSIEVSLDERLPIQDRLASAKIPEMCLSKTAKKIGALRFVETAMDANGTRRQLRQSVSGRVGEVIIEGLLVANAVSAIQL